MRWLFWKSSARVPMDEIGGTPNPQPPPRRHWRVLTASTVLVVLAATAAALLETHPWNPCGPGLSSDGPVCVGLNLDSSSFTSDDPLSGLEGIIAHDNANITGPGSATIVYLDDMEPNPASDSVGPGVLKHRVEGVIAAEEQANDPALAGPGRPRIKLLLANYGDGARDESTAVNAILQANQHGQHIVAVTGFGQSLNSTKNAIEKLSAHGITTVGSVISGDGMNQESPGKPIPNFYRVTSTNRDEARAAASFIKGKYHRIMLVQDQNDKDDYASNLGADFMDAAARQKDEVAFRERYVAPGGPLVGAKRSQYMTGKFAGMHADICSEKPDLVYFAGRGVDLSSFLAAIGKGGACGLGKMDIVSGDDANTIVGARWPSLNGVPVRVFYTGVATLNEWEGVPEKSDIDARNYQTFITWFKKHSFNSGDLIDGHAIMEYDAFLAAATALQKDPAAIDNPSLLAGDFYDFTCQDPVPGASGRIAFYRTKGTVGGQADPENQGNAIDKAVPVMELMPDGSVTQKTMAWSDGQPFDAPGECG